MSYSPDTDALAAALEGRSLTPPGQKPIQFRRQDIGTLQLPTGRIVACDPLVNPDAAAFTRSVAPGDYATSLVIARFDTGNERVALACLQFADRPVVRWEMALVGDQDPSTLGPDDYFGYGVDAGTGCFMDAAAAALLAPRIGADETCADAICEAMDAHYVHTHSWCDYRPDTAQAANVLCFSSGLGDGMYPSFFGLDDQGVPVMLLTDFSILPYEPKAPAAPPPAAIAPRRVSWKPWTWFASAAFAVLLAAPPAGAHHGISNWDLNKDLSITGTLAKIDLINPHAWLHVDVKGADGRVQAWRCEMRSAAVLRRSGWTADMFRVGTTITVTGSPERFKPRHCYLSTIQFADGSQMDRYGQRQAATAGAKPAAARALRTADGKPNLAGDWAAEQRVMTDPRGQQGTLVTLSDAARLKPGELPAGVRAFPGARGTPESLAADPIKAAWERPIPVKLTAAGREALKRFDPASKDNPRLRCEPTNLLFDWTFDSAVNRITQTPTRITLTYGHMDLQRVIHLDRSAPPAGTRPQRHGYSVGRWEGEALVVETTLFTPGVLNADARVLHGAGLRVTERYTLEDGGRQLLRRYEATDPQYFEDAWRGQDVVMPADVPYSPYRCKDPGGAPAEAAAAGRKP